MLEVRMRELKLLRFLQRRQAATRERATGRTHILSGAAPLFLNFFPVVAVFLRRHTSMAVGQSANQSADGPCVITDTCIPSISREQAVTNMTHRRGPPPQVIHIVAVILGDVPRQSFIHCGRAPCHSAGRL